MTDWSLFTHAYGTAEDIPDLLDQAAADPGSEAWSELWSALCHQGTVYPASFVALYRLAEIARADDREGALNALILAGGIMAGADQRHGVGDVRVKYAPQIAELLAAANAHRPTVTDRSDYGHLLQAVLGFEGVPVWRSKLAWGLDNGAYDIGCPDCRAGLTVEFGDGGYHCARRADYSAITFHTDGSFSLGGDHPAGEEAERAPLRPADPDELRGIGRRLYTTALEDGRPEIATTLGYIFGEARCTACGARFRIADRV